MLSEKDWFVRPKLFITKGMKYFHMQPENKLGKNDQTCSSVVYAVPLCVRLTLVEVARHGAEFGMQDPTHATLDQPTCSQAWSWGRKQIRQVWQQTHACKQHRKFLLQFVDSV